MRDTLGKVYAISAAETRRTMRDRTALFFMLLLPVFIILLVGLSFSGQANKLAIGVVDQDHGPLSAELQHELSTAPRIRLVRASSEDALRTAVRHAEVVSGIVIPTGYTNALRAGRPMPVGYVNDPTGQASVAARAPVASVVERQASIYGAARFAADQAGVSREAALGTAQSLSSTGGVTVDVTTESGRRVIPQGFNYAAPSNLILFVFVTSLAAAAVLVNARRLGVTRRMLATPTRPGVILFGQGFSRFVLALFEGLFIVVLGRLVFDVDWGNGLAAAVLVLVFALVSTGAALLMGTLARTEDQAGSMGPAIGIALGMLGGCMWPLFIVPPIMQTIGHGTPHAWAMDGFIVLIAKRGGLTDIAGNVLALGVFAAILLTIGAWGVRRTATR